MDDAQIATLRERHSVAEDTDTDADGNLVYVQFCGWDDSDDWPCETAQLIAALEASRAECARLEDAIDAADKLARFVAIGMRPATDCGEGCEHPACHIIRALRQYRRLAAALNGAADATVGAP